MFAQFEEGNILAKTRNDSESGDESDNESIMMSKQELHAINSGRDSEHDIISTEVLEDIRDRCQTHQDIDRREGRYKKNDRIRQKKSEWKGVLKATRSMRNVLHKVFSTIVKEISQ